MKNTIANFPLLSLICWNVMPQKDQVSDRWQVNKSNNSSSGLSISVPFMRPLELSGMAWA